MARKHGSRRNIGTHGASMIGGIIRSITDYPDVPGLDDEVRQRLVRRFGDGVQSWLEELPGRLLVLRERWSLEFDSVIPKAACRWSSALGPGRDNGRC